MPTWSFRNAEFCDTPEIPLFDSMRKITSNTNTIGQGFKKQSWKVPERQKNNLWLNKWVSVIFFFLDQHPHSLSKNYISITENISQPVNSLTHIITWEFQNRSIALVIIVFSQKSWYWLLISKNSSVCSKSSWVLLCTKYHTRIVF